MYDTIKLSGDIEKNREEIENLNMEEKQYITRENGYMETQGRIGNLQITLTPSQAKIIGSLNKFVKGNNYESASKEELTEGIKVLSDTLCINVEEMKVLRVDIGFCYDMQKEPSKYIETIQELKGHKRKQRENTLYLEQGKRAFVVYDKNKEQRDKRQEIPAKYAGRNILRAEVRIKKGVEKQLRIKTLKELLKIYEEIESEVIKLTENIKYLEMKEADLNNLESKKEIKDLGLLALIEKCGGIGNAVEVIRAKYKEGKINKQDRDRTIREMREIVAKYQDNGSDTIQELKDKIKNKQHL